MQDLDKKYEKIRLLFENSSQTPYWRRTKTENILEFIYGRIDGPWDYSESNASWELIEQLFLSFKRGKFLEKLCGKFKEKDKRLLGRNVVSNCYTYKIQFSIQDASEHLLYLWSLRSIMWFGSRGLQIVIMLNIPMMVHQNQVTKPWQ